jgi:uncharacterized membrane protein YwzB
MDDDLMNAALSAVCDSALDLVLILLAVVLGATTAAFFLFVL